MQTMTTNVSVSLIWKQMLEILPYYTLFYEPAEFIWLAQHAESNSAHLQVLATRREGSLAPPVRREGLYELKPPCTPNPRVISRRGKKNLLTRSRRPLCGRWLEAELKLLLCPPDKATEKKASFIVMDMFNKIWF